MTEIELMRDFPISLDGLRVEVWARGSQRRVSDEILAILIGEGACRIVENKAHVGAPENKAMPKRGRKGKK